MRDYILETHPDKLEYFDLCVKLGNIETESYWCYLKDKVTTDLYAEESSEFVGVFKKNMNGYKLADETIPYPSDDELIYLIKILCLEPKYISGLPSEHLGNNLTISKWQLFAQTYIDFKVEAEKEKAVTNGK